MRRNVAWFAFLLSLFFGVWVYGAGTYCPKGRECTASTVSMKARVVERGPVLDKSGEMIGFTRHDGSVYDGKKSIGRIDWNGNFASNQQLINERVLKTVEEYRSNTGACHIVKDGVEGVEESIGVYADDSSNFSLGNRKRGDNSSVPFTQPSWENDTKLVALIHNHPGKGQNPWPSVADVRSAIRREMDVYVVDCSDGGVVLRVNHKTGAVTKINPSGGEHPVEWNEFTDDAGVPIYRSNFLKQSQVKSASNLDGGDLYDPSRFADIAGTISFAKKEGGASVGKVKIPDLSKLIDAMRRIAECLHKINAMSSKPSEEDYAEYNKLMDKFAEEAEKVEKVLEDEIGKMKTEDEQVKFSKQLGDLFDRQYGGSKLCNEILSLQKQIQAKGYGRFTPRNLNLNVNFLK